MGYCGCCLQPTTSLAFCESSFLPDLREAMVLESTDTFLLKNLEIPTCVWLFLSTVLSAALQSKLSPRVDGPDEHAPSSGYLLVDYKPPTRGQTQANVCL